MKKTCIAIFCLLGLIIIHSCSLHDMERALPGNVRQVFARSGDQQVEISWEYPPYGDNLKVEIAVYDS